MDRDNRRILGVIWAPIKLEGEEEITPLVL